MTTLTIEESQFQDWDAFSTAVLERGDKKTFDDPNLAMQFMGECLHRYLARHGLDLRAGSNPIEFDRLMKHKGVRVETRRYKNPEHDYLSGLYVYRYREGPEGEELDRELTGFVSFPIRDRHPLMIRPYYEVYYSTDFGVQHIGGTKNDTASR